MKTLSATSFLLFALALNSLATTWWPAEHTCPVCDKKDTYQEIMSYGGYIYQWPSKFQYVYWPLTDSPSIYCCPHCYFSTYMWDFDSVPDTKINTIRSALKTIALDKDYKD